MPTWGIPAPRPRARLLLALFLPFLMQGGGIALATAKPLNLSQSSTIPRFLTPALLPPPDFLAAGGGSTGKRCPEPPHMGRSRKEGRGERCASGVPQDPSARQPPPAGTSRAGGLPALLLFPLRLPWQEPLWPVKLSVPPGSCAHHGQPGPVGQVAAGLGQPGQLSPPALSPGWPGAPSSPCMNVYFIRTDADHGI